MIVENDFVSARSISLQHEVFHKRAYGLLSDTAFPLWKSGSEIQGNAKWKPVENFTLGADLSVFLSRDSLSSTQWRIITSEFNSRWETKSGLSFLIGKKRISWGSSLVQNPMDFLNPPKNPINPLVQKEGAWIGEVEYPGEKYTLTALSAVEMEENEHGLWHRLNFSKRAFAARAYFLISGTDASLAIYHTHSYQNSVGNNPSLGVSVSRFITGSTELHFEGLIARSSNPLTPEIVTGTRTQFADDSIFSMEVVFAGDGESNADFNARAQALEMKKKLLKSLSGLTKLPLTYDSSLELKKRLYLSLNYQRWKMLEDVFLSSSILLNLQDSSGIFSPQVLWMSEDWLSFSAISTFSFQALRQPNSDPQKFVVSEFQLTPYDASVRVECKGYF